MSGIPPQAVQRSVAAFRANHEAPPALVVRAPGRVNLIGEHTDYNEGFVLPMALPFDTAIAASPTSDRRITVASEHFGSASFGLDDDPAHSTGWIRYVHGVASLLAADGHKISGWTGTIATDIPTGASLSSSAALEVAVGLVFSHLCALELDPLALATLGRRVENEILGLPSGIMDQLASAASVAGCASLIDCRSLSLETVRLPDGVTVVIIDTGTRRELEHSAYEARQTTCARVVVSLGVIALRDATLADLDRLAADDDEGLRRARHVITENTRTLATADALRGGDAREAGRLMNESHTSLRDDYEVSGPALDLAVGIAQRTPGCFGARMTGGGFAGCAVALVRSDAVPGFVESVSGRFIVPAEQPARAPLALHAVLPAAGAGVVTHTG